ncbi:MAG: hypothetical protein ISS01_00655 [Nanoarchaeota archaeon]|nr:hypothetical protein [Nanoarchaeota archaeon]
MIKNNQFKKGHIPWNKNQIIKTCLNCENKFGISKSRNLQKRGKYCSINCKKNYKYKLAKKFKINEDLAELIGIIVGDGCINKNYKRKDYRIQISGNQIEDKDYYDKYLPELIKKTLNINCKPYIGSNKAYIIQFQSEPFRIFLHNLGIKSPKAKTSNIPKIIKKNPLHLKSFIRGLADADFTLIFTKRKKGGPNYYPRIASQFASEILVKDLEKSLRDLGFTLNTKYNYKRKDKRGFTTITNFINLDGPINLNKWLKEIGFSNNRITTRYLVWKKIGYLKPKSTLQERKKIING